MSAAWVYTMWNAETGEPIYVGCTGNLGQRMRQHERRWWYPQVTWIGAVRFESRDEALEAESVRIHKLRPRVNRQFNPRCTPAWVETENAALFDEYLYGQSTTPRERKSESLRLLRGAA